MATIEMVKCNECGSLHEKSKAKVEERGYIAIDSQHHYCIPCSKKLTIYEAVVKASKEKAE